MKKKERITEELFVFVALTAAQSTGNVQVLQTGLHNSVPVVLGLWREQWTT